MLLISFTRLTDNEDDDLNSRISLNADLNSSELSSVQMSGSKRPRGTERAGASNILPLDLVLSLRGELVDGFNKELTDQEEGAQGIKNQQKFEKFVDISSNTIRNLNQVIGGNQSKKSISLASESKKEDSFQEEVTRYFKFKLLR